MGLSDSFSDLSSGPPRPMMWVDFGDASVALQAYSEFSRNNETAARHQIGSNSCCVFVLQEQEDIAGVREDSLMDDHAVCS
jgi:hypothetical protein